MDVEPVLVDAGPLIALYDVNDPMHAACVEQAKQLPVGKAFTCWPVLTEASYRIRQFPADQAKLFAAVRDGVYVLLPLHAFDLNGIKAVFDTFHDQDVDLADAALVHLAERENIAQVFTLDRRHFGVYRTAKGRPLEILPE